MAVVHGPPESGYRGASEAMVNIRFTLARAVRGGRHRPATRRALVAEAKAAFFPDRELRGAARAGPRERTAGVRARRARRAGCPPVASTRSVSTRGAMLEAMRDFLAADPPPARGRTFAFERTIYWERAEAAFRAAARRTRS